MKTGVVFDQVVGAVLQHYRKSVAKLGQQQASEGTGISVSSLSRLEKGDYSLTMDQLLSLSNRYGVSMTEMVSSIEKTYQNAIRQGIPVSEEKKSNASLLLLGAAALAAFVIASK